MKMKEIKRGKRKAVMKTGRNIEIDWKERAVMRERDTMEAGDGNDETERWKGFAPAVSSNTCQDAIRSIQPANPSNPAITEY